MKKTLFIILSLILASCNPKVSEDANRDIKEIVQTLWSTSCTDVNSERLGAMYRMQDYMDSLSSETFLKYNSLEDPEARREMEQGTVLWYYQAAVEKLEKEIPQTKVENGTVAIWLLYNMGYVVKTPSHCFAVDLRHMEAERLEPYLEFLMITHNHDDHFSHAFNKAMTDAGKPVFANWDSPDYPLTNIRETSKIDLGDIKIRTELNDHGKNNPGFVSTYLVDCGEDTGHTTIYFVGDSSKEDLLNPEVPVDIFVPHLAVGLSVPKAAEKIQPDCILVSHLLELCHPLTQWRWNYWRGFDVAHETHRKNVYVPVWGEKLIYTPTR